MLYRKAFCGKKCGDHASFKKNFSRRRSKELSIQMVAQILKPERTEEFHFKKPHSKKLEAASFTGYRFWPKC